ncbi:phage tail assembly protein [Pseudovibrio ascidiaceicola]|uniref:phage tail assembly protein n=1 Tax=Pseudovibrio ascidiaceicola TaxID=285279 RepID=UPI003D35E6DC
MSENTKRITLDYPIKVGGENCSHLNLRRVKLKDIREMNSITGDFEKALLLASRIIATPGGDSLSMDDVGEIDPTDFEKIQAEIENFLETGQKK